MTVIVCLDNANGMMFNHRRQSRDANVVKDILKTINGASLLIAPYSESLFSQAECSVSISESRWSGMVSDQFLRVMASWMQLIGASGDTGQSVAKTILAPVSTRSRQGKQYCQRASPTQEI